MSHQKVLILDFGGQNNQLVARRVRECSVYCEVRPFDISIEKIKEFDPVGIILTGTKSPSDEGNLPSEIFSLAVPLLAIGHGAEVMTTVCGGVVADAVKDLEGQNNIKITDDCKLFTGLSTTQTVWMGNYLSVTKLPDGFKPLASHTADENIAFYNPDKNLYGIFFHPEITKTLSGKEILRNFLYNICNTTGDWTMADFAGRAIEDIQKTVGDKKVLLALSGGVDSSVVAALLSKAIGKQLTCIFVDHGFMRKNEGAEVMAAFKDQPINLIGIDASDRFLTRVKGVTDPETKRKIIGEEFIRVFEEEAKKIGQVDFLAQGTIYPDILESGSKNSAVIKSHHNVGGLPDHVDFKEIIEPVRLLFKDEVRQLGKELGLADYLTNRQPFPGPGLAVRVVGELTREKLDILRDADAIFRQEIANANLDTEISQYFAVLTNIRSVGVTRDKRTYDYAVALRAVITTDFMTAQYAEIPHSVLSACSRRITDEVEGINRVLYDITNKPPATIEFE